MSDKSNQSLRDTLHFSQRWLKPVNYCSQSNRVEHEGFL